MSTATDSSEPVFRAIAVVGVGLIGGSIAAAVKQRGIAGRVVGIGRNAERLEAARQFGLLDEYETTSDAAAESDLLVVCTPVDRIVHDALAIAAALRPGSLITDAGSVKAGICGALSQSELPDGVTFIGSHPLAGSERAGWEHADPDLFEGRVCVVTPQMDSPPADCARLEAFWRHLGMQVVRMTPEDHDRALALTSHLPHVAAAALASLLTGDLRHLAATGFRDTTRIAGGDPKLWSAIFLNNAEPLTADIDQLISRLSELRSAIEENDEGRLQDLLEQGRIQRAALD